MFFVSDDGKFKSEIMEDVQMYESELAEGTDPEKQELLEQIDEACRVAQDLIYEYETTYDECCAWCVDNFDDYDDIEDEDLDEEEDDDDDDIIAFNVDLIFDILNFVKEHDKDKSSSTYRDLLPIIKKVLKDSDNK